MFVASAMCFVWDAKLDFPTMAWQHKQITKLSKCNEFDTGNLFTNGENHQGKTPSGDFKVTTPKNPLLSNISGYKYKKSYQTL